MTLVTPQDFMAVGFNQLGFECQRTVYLAISLCPIPERFWDEDAGEAETGNADEQPDQGIAGRNSSLTMGQGALLPSRLLPRLGGRPTGGGTPPEPTSVFDAPSIFGAHYTRGQILAVLFTVAGFPLDF
jgi:hypothetical protein